MRKHIDNQKQNLITSWHGINPDLHPFGTEEFISKVIRCALMLGHSEKSPGPVNHPKKGMVNIQTWVNINEEFRRAWGGSLVVSILGS